MLDRTIALAADSAREAARSPRRRAIRRADGGDHGRAHVAGGRRGSTARRAAAVLFLVLFTVTLPWSVVGFWNATIGFLLLTRARDPVAAVNPLAARIRGDEPVTASTAILMCIRNEAPAQVTRNLRPLLDGLVTQRVAHLFHVYPAERQQQSEIVAAEEACFRRGIRRRVRRRRVARITYRRRETNTGFKAGNIRATSATDGAAATNSRSPWTPTVSCTAPNRVLFAWCASCRPIDRRSASSRRSSSGCPRRALSRRLVPVRHAAGHAFLHTGLPRW